MNISENSEKFLKTFVLREKEIQSNLRTALEKKMKDSWGYHLLLDCKGGDLSLITDRFVIEDFVYNLIREIDMIPYGDIMIDRFATHDPEKAGISFCQMIETSHIAGHFCENTGDFYLDVFSCKEFDSKVVVDLVNKNFFPKDIHERFLFRDVNGEQDEC